MAKKDDPDAELIEVPILPESTIAEQIDLTNRKLKESKKSGKKIAIHLNIYSRNNIEESRTLEIHILLFMLLITRRLSISGTKFTWIDPNIKVYIEIQNSFMK